MKINLAVGIVILLIEIFLYVNADAIYGVYANVVRNTMLAYFVLLGLLSPFVIQVLQKIGPQDIPGFLITFVITSAVMLLVGAVASPGEIESGLTLALGFGFLHGFVKAFNEEVIFRGVVPSIIKGSALAGGWLSVGDVVAAVLFGIFHLAVTNVNIFAMVFLMGLGVVWAVVKNRFGIMGSTGSHFAYNLGALGVLSKILGGS